MSAWLLSPEELAELTGSPRKARQIAWLREHGYLFELGLDGQPKVLRAAVEAKLSPSVVRERIRTAPDLSALGKKHGKAA